MSVLFDGVCIDYGHGEDTAGKRYIFTDHDNLDCREYKTNRMTAARLIKLLVEEGRRVYDVVADREWTVSDVASADWCWHKLEQRDISLSNRVRRANERPSWLVLSIHSNAVGYVNKGPSLSARGGVMYTSPGNTRSDTVAESLWHAFRLVFRDQPVYMLDGDTRDGDHDNEARFYMLTKTRGAAVLGEMLFFVNIDDARFLLSAEGQDVIAEGYLLGLLPYIQEA